jgi:hypothetical protein
VRHEERVLLQVRLCVGAAARAASAGGASSDEACYRCGDAASAAGGAIRLAENYCWLFYCERKTLFRLKKQAEKDEL